VKLSSETDDGENLRSLGRASLGGLAIIRRFERPEAVADVPRSMDVMHRSVIFTASVGGATSYPAEQHVEEALAAADIAMHARKGSRAGSQRVQRERG